jgi:outer membrane lipoprotein-sorting protein
VRVTTCRLLPGLVLTVVLVGSGAQTQNPDLMTPEASEAKGRQILKQLVEGLGGPAYLNEKTSECDGRFAQFGHNGALTGYIEFKVYWSYPDKNRTDFAKKGNIIDLYAGDEGWTLDRGGVSEEPAPAVADFQEGVKRNINNLLRTRLKEDRMQIRFGGSSVVDLKQVDWVEITDSEERFFRLAVDHSSHLLVRSIVRIRDENSGEKIDETTVYSNYQEKDGVQVPMQVTKERDGKRVFQAFYGSCRVNPDLPADFFTKAALEKRYGEVGGKKKK